MEWFGGGVAAAIGSCRQENAIFIVYVHDDSAGSKTTDEAWSSKDVSELVDSRKYVALKVAKGSLEYNQFSQLYAVFLVPSIFCIGRTGQVLVAMNGSQTPLQLKEKLQDAFLKYDAEAQASPSSATSVSEPIAPANTPEQAQSTIKPSPGPAASNADDSTDSKAEESKEETLKRYQEKIKERRMERARDEFENDKKREIQRRELGKNVSKFKQQRDEQQTQDWLKERQKQKEEARLAREAVKAKLEQDKLERQSRQRDAAAKNQQVQDSSRPVSSPVTTAAIASVCRIQLKLPAGNARVVEMNKSDTLEALRECVAKEINENVDNIVLSSSYPRRELDTDSNSLTMLELQLAPSGVIVVRVKKSSYTLSLASGSGGGIVGALMSLVHLLLHFLSVIKNAVVGLFSGGGSTEATPHQRQPTGQYQERNIRNPKGVGDSGLRVRKFRQEDYHDDSEDDGTYNGNSTQQQ